MKNIKKDLVYAYKILASLSMDDHTYTHLSARGEDGNSFYIYPFGLRFCEVTEDKLLKVSLDGKILEGEEYQYNKTGYVIHGSIYRARQDINVIFHLHTASVVAVSAMKYGLLPISQWALHFYGRVSYHDYNSLALNFDEHEANITRDLGQNFVMLLRNHGVITCGRTVQEAMFYSYHLEMASKVQCLVNDIDNIILPNKEICESAVKDLLDFEENLGMRDWLAWVRMIDKL